MTERIVTIFDRKPSANLPSKRYDPWITAFEKIVSDAQKTINAISKHERLYNIIKEFLELQGLPNDTKINVKETYIGIKVNAQPTNKKAEIEDFYRRLSQTFINHSLWDRDNEVNIHWGNSFSYNVEARYWLIGGSMVSVYWEIPPDGIADLEVQTIRKEVMIYDTSYKLIPRVTPQTKG